MAGGGAAQEKVSMSSFAPTAAAILRVMNTAGQINGHHDYRYDEL